MNGLLKQNGIGTMPELGVDLQNLSLLVEKISPEILRIKIGAPGRWEVPRSIFNAPNMTGNSCRLKQLWSNRC